MSGSLAGKTLNTICIRFFYGANTKLRLGIICCKNRTNNFRDFITGMRCWVPDTTLDTLNAKTRYNVEMCFFWASDTDSVSFNRFIFWTSYTGGLSGIINESISTFFAFLELLVPVLRSVTLEAFDSGVIWPLLRALAGSSFWVHFFAWRTNWLSDFGDTFAFCWIEDTVSGTSDAEFRNRVEICVFWAFHAFPVLFDGRSLGAGSAFLTEFTVDSSVRAEDALADSFVPETGLFTVHALESSVERSLTRTLAEVQGVQNLVVGANERLHARKGRAFLGVFVEISIFWALNAQARICMEVASFWACLAFSILLERLICRAFGAALRQAAVNQPVRAGFTCFAGFIPETWTWASKTFNAIVMGSISRANTLSLFEIEGGSHRTFRENNFFRPLTLPWGRVEEAISSALNTKSRNWIKMGSFWASYADSISLNRFIFWTSYTGGLSGIINESISTFFAFLELLVPVLRSVTLEAFDSGVIWPLLRALAGSSFWVHFFAWRTNWLSDFGDTFAFCWIEDTVSGTSDAEFRNRVEICVFWAFHAFPVLFDGRSLGAGSAFLTEFTVDSSVRAEDALADSFVPETGLFTVHALESSVERSLTRTLAEVQGVQNLVVGANERLHARKGRAFLGVFVEISIFWALNAQARICMEVASFWACLAFSILLERLICRAFGAALRQAAVNQPVRAGFTCFAGFIPEVGAGALLALGSVVERFVSRTHALAQ